MYAGLFDLAVLPRGADPAEAVAWTVTAHSGSVQTVAIAEDGWIASGSSAGNVRVWSPDGAPVADIPIELDDPPTIAFAPGTNTLFYEDGDGVIRRFDIEVEATIEVAHSLLTRGFTPDECARYFPDERCPSF